MVYRGFYGQSAIEYLTTYGWMLLVVAVVGGAIFATVNQDSPSSVTGFTGSSVQVYDFGVTSDDDLEMELRSSTGEGATVSAINVTDKENGKYVYKEFSSNNSLDVGESLVFDLPNVSQGGGSSNSLDVEIFYDTGGLSNLTVSGSITGSLNVEETKEINEGDSDGGGGISLMQTVNYTYDSSGDVQVNETTAGSNGYQVDLNNDFSSEVEKIEIVEMHGADGGDGGASNNEPGDGGSGGLIQNYNISVSSLDTLQVWTGKTPCCAGNSYGRSDGGQEYGGGGGSTELWADDNSTFIAAADGGGGGAGIPSDAFFGVDDDYSAGGGGGRGGLGGTTTKSDGTTSSAEDGQSFDCGSLSCAGGDGGDANEQTGTLEDGDPGGQEINTSLVTDSGTQNLGGSDNGDGWILLKYYG